MTYENVEYIAFTPCGVFDRVEGRADVRFLNYTACNFKTAGSLVHIHIALLMDSPSAAATARRAS